MKKSMVFEAAVTLLLILLIFAMYAMIADSLPTVTEKWNMTIGQAPYLYAGDGGTLYAFTGDSISSIAGNGAVKWSIRIPDNRAIMFDDGAKPGPGYGYGYGAVGDFRPASEPEPAFASCNGTIYVYTMPRQDPGESPVAGPENTTLAASIMAISPDGRILWNTPFPTGASVPSAGGVRISASSGRIYVYYGSLAVFSTNGSPLFGIDDIMAPPSMDEQGDIYAVKRTGNGSFYPLYGYTGTFNTIVAYHPNGSPWWQKEMKEPLQYQYLDLSLVLANTNAPNSMLPLYHDGIIYVPLKKSLVALDRGGDELWSVGFRWEIHPFLDMTFDPQNNVYLVESTEPVAGSDGVFYQGVKVALNGTCSNYTIEQYGYSPLAIRNGIGYYAGINGWKDKRTGGIGNPTGLTDLISWKILAVDLDTGKNLWNFTVSSDRINKLTLTPSNAYYLDTITPYPSKGGTYYAAQPESNSIPASASESAEYNDRHPELQSLNKSAIGPWKMAGAGTIKVLPGDTAVYVSYYMYNYEYPASLTLPPYDDGSDARKYPDAAVFNRSELAYASGILAIDGSGRLLWNKPTDSMVTTMAANNSTVYYGTESGKLSATRVNAAIGFALAALAYLFLRFVCVGAVARARARLGKNENRNRVLNFIVANPGSSLYEIARGTGMNLGTVRYHLFILGVNHKVTVSQSDGKYVRYFTNSGSFSKEEQLVLSLMRRGVMGRMLELMLQKPGLSNVEIARALGIQESVVSRCARELSEKNVIAREAEAGGTYRVHEAYTVHVADAIKRLQGQ